MKKKLLIMLLCLTTAFSLSACGKSKEEKEQEEFEKEIEEMREDLGLEEGEDIWDEMAREDAMIAAEKEQQAEAQESYKVYGRISELDSIENPFLATQVDDSLYKVGQTVGDIMTTIDKSEIEYTYDQDIYGYTPTMIVNAGSSSLFGVKRDGADWFNIYYYNPTDDVASINDCICYSIVVCEDALPFSRVLGLEPDAWEAMTYNDIETLAEDGKLLSGFKAEQKSGSDITSWDFEGKFTVNQDGYDYTRDAAVNIEIDMKTGTVCNYQTELSKPQIAVSFGSISDEGFDNVIEEAKKEILEDVWIYGVSDSCEFKVTDIYYVQSDKPGVLIYFELTDGGKVGYDEAYFYEVEIENSTIINKGVVRVEYWDDLERFEEEKERRLGAFVILGKKEF